MNMCLVWQDEIYKMTLYKQKNILSPYIASTLTGRFLSI